MARRFIGEARIYIEYAGTDANGNDEYVGAVIADRRRWKFSQLYAPKIPNWSGAYDSPEAFDKMAESAVSFASFYTTDNRGDDVPDWAPDAATADAIAQATWGVMDDQGNYEVRRVK